jgi:pimeloyl-ACP methyl ester carboxylesterase
LRLLLAPLLGATLLSCAPGPRLVDERATAPYRALLAARDALPRTPVTLPTGHDASAPSIVSGDLVRGPRGDGAPLFVLLNGVFSDRRTWRFLVGPLAARGDVLALDLPGTGASDPREPDDLEPDAYTPRWLADRTLEALEAHLAREPRARPIVLVGHSVAGTAVLRALGDPALRERYGATLARVAAAALIAPADVAAPSWHPTLVELARLSAFEVRFADALGLLRPRVDRAIAAGVLHPDERALVGEPERVVEVLGDRARRRASQAMLRRVQPTRPDGARDEEAIAALAADHGRVGVPTLLVWGRDDDVLPLAMGEKLAREIPGSRLAVIEDARHSVHQERPVETSAAILAFADAAIAR